MITELVAVVCGDDEDGFVPLTALLKRRHDPAQLAVDLAHHAVVLRPKLSASLFGRRRRAHRQAQGDLVERVSILHRHESITHVCDVVARGPLPCRGVGRVGPQVAQMGKPPTLLARQPLEESVGQEGAQRVLGGTGGLEAKLVDVVPSDGVALAL